MFWCMLCNIYIFSRRLRFQVQPLGAEGGADPPGGGSSRPREQAGGFGEAGHRGENDGGRGRHNAQGSGTPGDDSGEKTDDGLTRNHPASPPSVVPGMH